MVHLRFREDRTTQAVAKLLKLEGGRMNVLKLMKLLYFVDREALLAFGRPISFDWYYSLPHGPVLSYTLNLLNSEQDPERPSYWHRFVSEREGHTVSLADGQDSCPLDQLSPAESQLIGAVYDKLGALNHWQLRERSHQLPEWVDPEGSRLEIELEGIFLAEGFSEDDAASILDELAAEQAADRVLG